MAFDAKYSGHSFSFNFFSFSKHHQSFDPFEEQKETSFKELQGSAISLAQFLCNALETPVREGDGGNVKTIFDTFLQVHGACTKIGIPKNVL